MAKSDTSRPTKRPPLPSILGKAIEPFYRLEINRRNRSFDRGRGITRLRHPVISVGNLSVGGTGKTPMVARILTWLREAGHDPCIAMRGYKGTNGESDEALAYARSFEDLPIVAQPNRLAGLKDLSQTPRGKRVDCIVLDDGFQHRRIARDLDIVLIDATHNPFADALLPAGWLREPVQSLSRAHAAVVTHAEQMTSPMTRELWFPLTLRLGKGKPVALTRHAWDSLHILANGSEGQQPIEWLQGRNVMAVCAIGNPDAFIDELARRTDKPEPELTQMILRDHDPYQGKTVRRILELAESSAIDAIVTTDKDWSKLQHVPADRWPCPVVRPQLELRFDRGESDLKQAVLAAARGDPNA